MFEIKTSRDKLGLLVRDYERLVWDPLNISLAEKCCQDAWHLADWDFVDQRNVNHSLTQERYRDNLFAKCPEMKILHDLAIYMKHRSVTRPKAKIEKAVPHEGQFSPEFSKEHDVSGIIVTLDDGKQIDVDELIKIAIDYWTKSLVS